MEISALETARLAATLALDKKGLRPVILEFGVLSAVADYFVIVSGRSSTQTFAIADHIEQELSLVGVVLRGKESDPNGKWILLDFVSVIVHVFDEDTRDFYNLERLWGEAKSITL